MRLCVDYRLGGTPRYFMGDPDERLMLIPDEIRKSVCFVCSGRPEGICLEGTGFFIAKMFESVKERGYLYFVTAKHIIWRLRNVAELENAYLRINNNHGDVELLRLPLGENEWICPPEDSCADAAIFKHPVNLERFDCLAMPAEMLLSEEMFRAEGVGLGDEVIVVGLFHKHYGRKRNTPIVRVGNLSCLPEEPIRTKLFGNHVDISAYLIEARSISGLSGSPVLVNLGQSRVIGGRLMTAPNPRMFILGLIHGHWDENVATEDSMVRGKLKPDVINTGIAIVTPAAKIIDALNHPDIVQQLRDAEKRYLESNLPTLDSATIPVKESSDNPNHKEGFDRLLEKAVKGRKSDT